MRHRVPRGQEEALDVDSVGPVEFVFRHVEHRLVSVRRAGVVDDDVEVAAFVEREADELADIGVAGDVGDQGAARPPAATMSSATRSRRRH